jgi:hypothetical protein
LAVWCDAGGYSGSLEGSLGILAGSALVAAAGRLRQDTASAAGLQVTAFVLIAIALRRSLAFPPSAGVVGGQLRRSMWWVALLVSYPIVWGDGAPSSAPVTRLREARYAPAD